jgi:hypothetical protein
MHNFDGLARRIVMKSSIGSVDQNPIHTDCRDPQRLNKVADSVEVRRVEALRKSWDTGVVSHRKHAEIADHGRL